MAQKCREIERRRKVEGLVDDGRHARYRVLGTACGAQNAPRFVEPSTASRPTLNHKPPSIGMPRIKMPCVKYGVLTYYTKVQRDRTKKKSRGIGR